MAKVESTSSVLSKTPFML